MCCCNRPATTCSAFSMPSSMVSHVSTDILLSDLSLIVASVDSADDVEFQLSPETVLMFDWLSQSKDHHQIENLWKELKRAVHS